MIGHIFLSHLGQRFESNVDLASASRVAVLFAW